MWEAKGRTVMPSMMIYGLISMSPDVSSDVTVMCTFLRTASYNQGRDNYIFFEKQTSHLSGHICSCNGCDAVGTMHPSYTCRQYRPFSHIISDSCTSPLRRWLRCIQHQRSPGTLWCAASEDIRESIRQGAWEAGVRIVRRGTAFIRLKKNTKGNSIRFSLKCVDPWPWSTK